MFYTGAQRRPHLMGLLVDRCGQAFQFPPEAMYLVDKIQDDWNRLFVETHAVVKIANQGYAGDIGIREAR
jgi:hypothetical protein